MPTDKYPWKSVFTAAGTGKETQVRASSTYDFAREFVQKEAHKHPAVIEAGGKGIFSIRIEVQPTAGVPVPAPVPKPPVPAPQPPAPTPPAPTPVPSGNWVEGKSSATEPTGGRPAKGVASVDPSFKTQVFRVSDRTDGYVGFARNDYSRRQAFNADNSLQLTFALDGHWHIFDANTFKRVARLVGPAGDAEPQWHPTNPDLLYYLPTNGVGMRVLELNVKTNASRVVGTLGPRLQKLWPGATYAWTKSEGSPSADGRFWCFMVDSSSWSGLGVVVWDMQTDTILGHKSLPGRPDHVSMSPSGKWAVVSSDDFGTIAYSPDFKVERKLHHKSEHSDIALLPNGDDAYVAVDYQSPGGNVFFTNIQTGVRTTLFPSYPGGRAFHFSGKAYGLPGWVLVSSYGESGGTLWSDKKITLVELKADPRILNVAWTRARFPSKEPYFFEPHATISRDGSRVAFTSSWGGTVQSDLHAYQVRLPAVK